MRTVQGSDASQHDPPRLPDEALNTTVATSTAAPEVARPPLVTVATVCWNHSYLIKGFLKSFIDKTPAEVLSDVQLVVVDNGSTDHTGSFLESWLGETAGPASKTVIRTASNLGFAAGANLAVQHATGRYLLLLNNDVEFTGDLVRACVRAYPAECRAILGTKLIYKPGPWNQLHGKVVRYLEGWCLFADMDVFREIGTTRDGRLTGIFDETFSPAFYEDMDLSLRAHLAGIALRQVSLPVRHLESRTTKATPSFQFMDVIYENQRRFQAKWRDIRAESI